MRNQSGIPCSLYFDQPLLAVCTCVGSCALLTDAHWEEPRPAVVLLADSHRGSDQLEPRVALVHHRVSIAKVLPDHLPIHDLLRESAVTRCGGTEGAHTANRADVNMFYSSPRRSVYAGCAAPCCESLQRRGGDMTEAPTLGDYHSTWQSLLCAVRTHSVIVRFLFIFLFLLHSKSQLGQ